ncbi:hypothetical protein GIB67_024294 [Kingdonia uniflora]|uniref:Uncharacterized protein n=1 Tax=Kingdonia uniflora TaxID=39325 RepID=A0A7J7LF91_9MAGN|nr:hypothetical protein GIB67_024294 [Kingdonia uniflora]
MNTALLAMGDPIDTNAILESDQSATTVNLSAIMFANIANSGGTSIDQSIEQNKMGLIISNLGINNTIYRDISEACLIMNTTLLALGNPIDTNTILESDQYVTTINPSAIVSANTAVSRVGVSTISWLSNVSECMWRDYSWTGTEHSNQEQNKFEEFDDPHLEDLYAQTLAKYMKLSKLNKVLKDQVNTLTCELQGKTESTSHEIEVLENEKQGLHDKVVFLEKEVSDANEKMKSTLDKLCLAKLDVVLSRHKLEKFFHGAKNIDKVLCMGKTDSDKGV